MRIPFGTVPSTTALFLDYVADRDRVLRFFPEDYSIDSILNYARRRPRLESSHLEKLCAALSEQQKQWGAQTESLDKLRGGAVVVIAGQQPGLFTGPSYTILKAITVIKLAQVL